MPDIRNYVRYPDEESGLFSRWAPTVIRGAGAVLPGGLIGAGGNALLEAAAQTGENVLGTRSGYNPAQIATQAGIGLIPFGKAATLGRTLAKGAGLGAGATLATQQAETGLHAPTSEELGGVAIGGLLGAGGAGIARGLQARYGKKGNIPEAEIKPSEILPSPTGTKFEPGEIPKPLIKSGTIELKPQNVQMATQPSPTVTTWGQSTPVGGGKIIPEVTIPGGVTREITEVKEPTIPGKIKPSTKAPPSVRFNATTGKIELEGPPIGTKTTGRTLKKTPAKVTSKVVKEEVHPVTGKKIQTQVVEEAGVTKKNEKIQEPLESRKRIPKVHPVTGRPIEPETEMTGLGTDVDREAAISMLTNLYEGDMATIAAKELVQNSLDNVRPQGKNGLVQVDLDEPRTSVSVKDNGTGMTPNQLKTVYMIIGKTGKKAGGMDIGGYGVAKAAFQLGGKNFSIETIARDVDGKLKKTSFTATPEDFKQKRITAKIEEMPEGTPTGTNVTVQLNPGNYNTRAKQFIENVGRYSGTEGKIQARIADFGDKIETMPYKDLPNSLKTSGKVLGTKTTNEADYTFIMPENVRQGRFPNIEVALLNKGMYQGSFTIKGEGSVVPETVMVDVSSKVDALDSKYPFTPSRERLKGMASVHVSQGITEHVLDAANKVRRAELQKLYDDIPDADFMSGSRGFKFLDPKGLVGSDEMKVLEQSDILNSISAEWSDLVNSMISKMSVKYPHWNDHIEKMGFMMTEPGYYGVHLPNPTTKKGAVFVNPFNHFLGVDGITPVNPLEAAYNMHHTMVHEVAHSPSMIGERLTPHESANFEEMIGEAYAKLNVTADKQRANLVRAISDDNGQTYSPGVQELLSWYKATIRRSATKEDLLSGTGIKSAASKSGVEKSLATNIRSTGKGTTSGGGGGGQPPKGPSVNIPGEGGSTTPPVANPWEEFKKLSRWGKIKALMNEQRQGQTSLDLSFPFRQGIGAITRKEFWNNIKPMISAAESEGGYQRIVNGVDSSPRIGMKRKAGLEITHLEKEIKKSAGREEQQRGVLLEHYLPPVRMSNRAYTAMAVKLRSDLFDAIADNAERLGVDLGDGNNANAKAIADLVNDMTGRGRLPFDLDRIADKMNNVFFSPKLIASRLNMFRRAFNDPRMLSGVDPKLASQLRKEALRSMAGVGSMALLGGGISALMLDEPAAGDPLSTDFGKLKMGKTRIDLTGGFQQYVRAAAQLASGMANVEGKEFGDWDERNRLQTSSRFLRNKLSPVASSIVDWMAGQNVVGEEFSWGKETKEALIPLILQDLEEIYIQDKGKLPIAGPAAFVGAGVQSYGEDENKPVKSKRQRSQSGRPGMFRVPKVKLYQPGL